MLSYLIILICTCIEIESNDQSTVYTIKLPIYQTSQPMIIKPKYSVPVNRNKVVPLLSTINYENSSSAIFDYSGHDTANESPNSSSRKLSFRPSTIWHYSRNVLARIQEIFFTVNESQIDENSASYVGTTKKFKYIPNLLESNSRALSYDEEQSTISADERFDLDRYQIESNQRYLNYQVDKSRLRGSHAQMLNNYRSFDPLDNYGFDTSKLDKMDLHASINQGSYQKEFNPRMSMSMDLNNLNNIHTINIINIDPGILPFGSSKQLVPNKAQHGSIAIPSRNASLNNRYGGIDPHALIASMNKLIYNRGGFNASKDSVSRGAYNNSPNMTATGFAGQMRQSSSDSAKTSSSPPAHAPHGSIAISGYNGASVMSSHGGIDPHALIASMNKLLLKSFDFTNGSPARSQHDSEVREQSVSVAQSHSPMPTIVVPGAVPTPVYDVESHMLMTVNKPIMSSNSNAKLFGSQSSSKSYHGSMDFLSPTAGLIVPISSVPERQMTNDSDVSDLYEKSVPAAQLLSMPTYNTVYGNKLRSFSTTPHNHSPQTLNEE